MDMGEYTDAYGGYSEQSMRGKKCINRMGEGKPKGILSH
jgi:hypothetical protein